MTTVSIAHLREWAESRFEVASGLAKSAEVPKRQQWQERGKGQILRDFLRHLDTLAAEPEEEICPACGRRVKIGREGRMITHRPPGDGRKGGMPKCQGSNRRPENALLPGSLLGRSDLRREGR